VDCCDEREVKKDEREGSEKMTKKTKPNPAPKQDNRSANVVATYFLAKHSGLFLPGTPHILAHTIPRKTTKGKSK
jgi:hypothetical protein